MQTGLENGLVGKTWSY